MSDPYIPAQIREGALCHNCSVAQRLRTGVSPEVAYLRGHRDD